MEKKKVVVVDDSAFMRKMLGDMIEKTNKFQVVAKLRNGKELLDKIEDLKPDAITLDVEMPIMDGLETLKELKKRKVEAKILMISSLTSEGSKMTMECLMNGAIDFIEKPSGAISLDIDKINIDLIEKLTAITNTKNQVFKNREVKAVENIKEVITVKESSKGKKIEAVLIGASTGGPRAIQEVVLSLEKLEVPIIVVQHMPKGFTKAFADRLNGLSNMNIVEADEGMELRGNTVYIAKGGMHLEVGRDKKIHLDDGPTLWGVKPAVDKMFSSGAVAYKGRVLSVVLTGMGKDGAKGTELVKEFGGITISESQETCVIYGMPKAAYETGKVDYVISLHEIGKSIVKLVKEV